MSGVEHLRSLIAKLHEEHGGVGDFLSCFPCVIEGLNISEREYVEELNRRYSA